MQLIFHPESDCYFVGNFDEISKGSDPDSQLCVDVSESEFHIQEAAKRGIKLESFKEERPKRKLRKGKSVSENPTLELLNAFKFLLPTQRNVANSKQNFCIANNGWIVAENDILTIGHKISENINCNPQIEGMIDALSLVCNEVSITQVNKNALSISSGAFKAVVPCIDNEEISIEFPDLNVLEIDDSVKDAFANLYRLVNEKSSESHLASVLLQSNSAVATDGYGIIEYWHGFAKIPENLLIPKSAAVAVIKSPYALTGFGYSKESVTFYFENESFIRTRLVDGNWPEYLGAISSPGGYSPVHPDFIKAVKFAESFSPTGNVFMMGDYVRSSPSDNMVSIYKIGGLPDLMGFKAQLIYRLRHAIEQIYFFGTAVSPKMYFCGKNMRGALAGVSLEADKYNRDNNVKFEAESLDDDIPF